MITTARPMRASVATTDVTLGFTFSELCGVSGSLILIPKSASQGSHEDRPCEALEAGGLAAHLAFATCSHLDIVERPMIQNSVQNLGQHLGLNRRYWQDFHAQARLLSTAIGPPAVLRQAPAALILRNIRPPWRSPR